MRTGAPRPCLGCGELTDGTRCPTCAGERWQAAYGGGWRQLSKQEREREPWCHCAGCSLHPGQCQSTTDLTLDHDTPVSWGGTAHDGHTVLCQRCNTARRDRL